MLRFNIELSPIRTMLRFNIELSPIRTMLRFNTELVTSMDNVKNQQSMLILNIVDSVKISHRAGHLYNQC